MRQLASSCRKGSRLDKQAWWLVSDLACALIRYSQISNETKWVMRGRCCLECTLAERIEKVMVIISMMMI